MTNPIGRPNKIANRTICDNSNEILLTTQYIATKSIPIKNTATERQTHKTDISLMIFVLSLIILLLYWIRCPQINISIQLIFIATLMFSFHSRIFVRVPMVNRTDEMNKYFINIMVFLGLANKKDSISEKTTSVIKFIKLSK